ncbi:MAG: HAMP domain-containing protein [Gemmatimonadetes bacterium]|nr:HAMP domain-containing protein [Gemmatimonadota bacterium]MXY83931.1 HAMP domain-containing protein [Gemmatimonadota bacterium]MYB71353.1 HAMP domain-containing protein [Gemmatimonadota bacterium]
MRQMFPNLKTWTTWRGKRQRLWLRLLGYYLALGLVPVLLVGLFVLNATRDAIEEAVLDSRREMAHRTAEEIAHIFSPIVSNLKSLARTVGTVPQAWHTLLKEAELEYSEVETLYLVNAQNQIQASSAAIALPASYDWDATWAKVVADSLYFTLIEEFRETPKLFVALPVERDGQPPQQALIARLDFHRVWSKINLIRIGRTGYATLLHADDGHYLARPMRQSFYTWRDHPHIEAMRGPAGILLWRDVGGTEWVSGFAPVRDWDWIVAIEQREDEAHAPYTVVLYSIYAIIAFSALGALLLGGLTRSSVVVPLVSLTYAVRRRRDGYPLIGTPVKRRDEIGELADAFVEMDQTLAERQRDLESTLDLQRHLIEDNPLAIAVLDADYRIVQSNKAWASLLLPEQDAELSATHAGAQVRAWLKAHPHLQVVDDLAIEDAEGVMRYWNLHKAELSQGHRGKVLLVVEDRTQQHLLELHYMQAEKLSALGEVAAGVAHEIKNPLAIVQNTCDLLPRLGPEEEKERDETLQMMREAIRRIDERVGSLLDFARPAQHLVEQIDAAEVLRQLLDLETKHAEHLGISIERQFEPVPAVRINRDMLKDIYINIIRNAFQAMPQGGRLQVSARSEQEGVAIEICDTGTGIDPTQLSRIFEPFFSTKAPGEGTGLGLAIAQRQLREIGGHIEVTSRVGQGTCFALLLPYNKEEKA